MNYPTPAQISALIEAAGFASGVRHGTAELLSQTEQYESAAVARKAMAALDSASWAAMGRPTNPQGEQL